MRYVVDVDGVHIDVALDGEDVRCQDIKARARLVEVDTSPARLLTIGDRIYSVVVRRKETRGAYTLWINGDRFEVDAVDERARAIRDLAGASATRTGPAPIRAPMPGLIVRVTVEPGDVVQAGQGLVVMEAMKMENELRAESGGVVRAVHAVVGRAVEKGSVLIELE
jgi:pyruvate carboxylase subunit B